MSKGNDRTLRFLHEVLELERLHYGIWLPDDEISIAKLVEAQERYEDYLVENIPHGVKKILDVGCGTGIFTKKLISLGYDVEGLSPDINQKKVFTETTDAAFHHLAFEDFSESDCFDSIVMSESAQYIHMDKIFENAKRSLRNSGYLLICDYFSLSDGSAEFSRSGHGYDDFMNRAKNSGFTVVSEDDITERVVKTLDLGRVFAEKVMKTLGLGTEKIRDGHPHIWRFLFWIFRKRIKKVKRQMRSFDSREFQNNKTYRLVLLQVDSQ